MRDAQQCLPIYGLPNGGRYPLVGGLRGRHFDGTNSKPRKLLENAATPTSRVHALLGGVLGAMRMKTCFNVCLSRRNIIRLRDKRQYVQHQPKCSFDARFWC